MGPIDFTKFDAVISKYETFFDFGELSKSLIPLKEKYSIAEEYLSILCNPENLKAIILAKPNEILKWKEKFDKILVFDSFKCSKPVKLKKSKTEDCTKCPNCKKSIELNLLSESIIRKLDYVGKGKKSLQKVYSIIGIKTCYICNAQYALTVDKETGVSKIGTESIQTRNIAKYQFDHYLPKSKYPCFSISLYNLFPICSCCNAIKGNRDIGIDYYDSSKLKDAFCFKVLEDSLVSYLLDEKPLEIDFIDEYKYEESVQKLSDRFDIKGIYNTQLDLIEDLIYRKLNYTESYKSVLSNSFPSIFLNTTIEERIKLGTYSKKEGIHKKPMSKFLQDIDSQLDEYFKKKSLASIAKVKIK